MFLSLLTLCIPSLGCALLVPLVQGTCSIQGPKSRWAFSRVCQSPCRPLPLQPLHLFLPQIIQKTPFFTLNCLQQAQTRLPRWAHRASNPPHWGILHPPGNSVLMKMFESRWALQVSPAVSPLPAQPHVPVPSLWGRSGLLRGQRHPRHGHPRGLREGQEVAALAPRLGPCFLFRCGWDFPALAVGPRSAPAAALFSISKAAEADGFNATAISSVPKAGGTGHLPETPGGFGQGRRWQSPWDTRASPPCPAVSHPTAS